jgi:hypothetical protein
MYNANYSPPSSPASSPLLGPIDSSPPSSPLTSSITLNDTPPRTPTTLTHPFAASAKATRPLPLYERKSDASPSSPARASTSHLQLDSPTRYPHALPRPNERFVEEMLKTGAALTPGKTSRAALSLGKHIPEERLWEDTIEDAILERNHQKSEDKTVLYFKLVSLWPAPLQPLTKRQLNRSHTHSTCHSRPDENYHPI